MNIYELKKLADEWTNMWNNDKFPNDTPLTVKEMDRRKIANTDFDKHCRKYFMEALGFIKDRPNTGDCMTCDNQIGTEDMQHCRLGNDTKRASCCYHSKSQMQLLAKLENPKS